MGIYIISRFAVQDKKHVIYDGKTYKSHKQLRQRNVIYVQIHVFVYDHLTTTSNDETSSRASRNSKVNE